MAPGEGSTFGTPMFEPEVFRKQMYCFGESTCDIVVTFRRPRSDSAPGELFPLSPLVTPLRASLHHSTLCNICKSICRPGTTRLNCIRAKNPPYSLTQWFPKFTPHKAPMDVKYIHEPPTIRDTI